MERRPTMRDVANSAAVSFKTVSRVVNGGDGVRPELADRVRQAISSLGYQPDHRAQLLRRSGGGTATIGFVLPDIANPFFSAIYRGLEDVAWEAGHVVVAGSSDGASERGQQILRTLIARRVDGLVLVPSGDDHSLIAAEISRGTPVVLLDIEVDDLPGVDVVRSDHRQGARLATEHLIRHGHRRIAFLGDADTIFSAAERRRGYLDALASASLDIEPALVISSLDGPATAAAAVDDLLTGPAPPTALFSAQNFITIGAVHVLHRLGLQRQVAHVGFDDVDLAAVVDPGITVMPQQPTELGRLAARLLLERIAGSDDEPHRLILESELIPRGSGEILPP